MDRDDAGPREKASPDRSSLHQGGRTGRREVGIVSHEEAAKGRRRQSPRSNTPETHNTHALRAYSLPGARSQSFPS